MAGGALPGFRDFYPDEFAQRAHIFRAWREVARRFAFVEYDGPPLEPLDLYTKKSGAEIAGQLYNFTDKGGREVALRPEMTPTFARMVGERANALKKPVRWFSIPQLFRYERAQRGRLREHYQLNVDIVGEASELADAELLCVAISIMKELGLDASGVRARVSDRRLLGALLGEIGVTEASAQGAAFAVLDKVSRQPREISVEKLTGAGLSKEKADAVLALPNIKKLADIPGSLVKSAAAKPHLDRMTSYFAHLESLGVRDWVDLDLSIVRGLDYYTGIVFELFDAKGELRAICGGGRYDNLLNDLGGTDLPALGFGMGDVVLGELLKERHLMPASSGNGADLYFVGGNGALEHPIGDALRLANLLRGAGLGVDYALNAERYQTQPERNQVDNAKKSGARAVILFQPGSQVVVQGIIGKLKEAPKQEFAAGPLLAGDASAVTALRNWFDEHISLKTPSND
ncbi:MAG TPA: histidine--tRNA ligase [Gemmatimonadaceae bacterium]|jgi:histidyl-tRNA synthetase